MLLFAKDSRSLREEMSCMDSDGDREKIMRTTCHSQGYNIENLWPCHRDSVGITKCWHHVGGNGQRA